MNANPARPLILLLLILGALGVGIGLAFPYFNIADNFLTFDLTQVFWVGAFLGGLGLVLWLLPLLANSRNLALLIIAIGIIGVGVTLVYTYGNIADNFLSFNLTHIFWLGVVYIVVGFILLMFARSPTRAERPPMVRESKAGAPKSEPKPERPTAAGMPRVDAVAFAPRPTPDDLTVIEGIGPKVQEALNSAGVFTYSQLAHMTAQELYQVVKVEQGVRIVGDTATWTKQAQFLVDGDMKGLQAYQAKLVGGREEQK